MRYLFGVAVMLLFVSNVDAQYCGRSLRQNVIVQPYQAVQQTYFQQPYQQSYIQQDYYQQPLIVGIPVQNFGLNYYYSVGDELREERIAELVAKQLKLQTAPVPTPSSSPIKDNNQSPVDEQVLTIFTDSCIMCHTPGQSNPGVQLFNEDGSLFVDADPVAEMNRRWKIFDSTFGGDAQVPIMPKGQDPIPDEDIAVIRQWVRSYTN